MGDKVFKENLVPGGSIQDLNVEETLLLYLLDLGEECFRVVGRKTRVQDGSVIFNVPLEKSFVV